MILRKATIQDAEALAEIGARTFYDTYVNQMPEEDLLQSIEDIFSPAKQTAELKDPQSHFIVVEINSELIGYVKLSGMEEHAYLQNPVRAIHLSRLYLLKNWIGYGIGKALMQACIDHARKQAYHAIKLEVWEHNHKAMAFYKKWGYEQTGVVSVQIGNERQSDLVMRLNLS